LDSDLHDLSVAARHVGQVQPAQVSLEDKKFVGILESILKRVNRDKQGVISFGAMVRYSISFGSSAAVRPSKLFVL
jgi:hypothetical protein